MLRVVHFEVTADDPERASRFYQGVFGWGIHKWEGPQPYWLIQTGPDGTIGINGGIMQRNGGQMNYINTIEVPSVDEYVAKVEAAGGSLQMAKMEIPNVGFLVYCKDPEGNLFGMLQPTRPKE